MTPEQTLILLSARKAKLQTIQNCMSEGHHFSLATVKTWWEEARQKVSEIETLERQIREETEENA